MRLGQTALGTQSPRNHAVLQSTFRPVVPNIHKRAD